MPDCARHELRRGLAKASSEGGADFARDSPGPQHAAARTGPGTLYVVATPIGNLEDITLRALRILREVAVVAAEDTRRTANLLRHYGLHTPLLSLHEHNERQRVESILGRLERGESVALVSDAGTPAISDPGAILIRGVRHAGFRVDAIPGPSAVAAALSASGMEFERFLFVGFPPVRGKARIQWFERLRHPPDCLVICFEAPHRVHRTLHELRSLLVNRPIAVARELTKTHEEWLFLEGDPLKLPPERGEFVILIGPTQGSETARNQSEISDDQVAALFGQMTAAGSWSTRRQAVHAVAERLQLPAKTVYDALERAKKVT